MCCRQQRERKQRLEGKVSLIAFGSDVGAIKQSFGEGAATGVENEQT